MQRASRLLQLLQVLRVKRCAVTAGYLADSFAISERTVYRDMKALQEIGVPLEGEAGTGFILRPGFFLPAMAFTEDEADALLLGLRFVMARGGEEFAKAADTALLKVTEGMGDEAVAKMLGNGLTVGRSGIQRPNEVKTIRQALRDRRKLRLRYRAENQSQSELIVWPVALGFFDEFEVLAAWCELHADFRHFRLDRMKSLTKLENDIPRSRDSLLAAYREVEPNANV